MEEEGEEVEQGRSCHRCLLGTAGPMGEVEGAGLGGQQGSARKMEEEEGEAGDGDGDGDGGEEEEAAGGLLLWEVVEEVGLLEFPVWRAVVEEELRRGPWTEEGEEGLRGCLWTGEEEEVELSCGGAEEEEEGHRHEKEVVEVLQGGDKRHDQVTSSDDITQQSAVSVNKVSQTAH